MGTKHNVFLFFLACMRSHYSGPDRQVPSKPAFMIEDNLRGESVRHEPRDFPGPREERRRRGRTSSCHDTVFLGQAVAFETRMTVVGIVCSILGHDGSSPKRPRFPRSPPQGRLKRGCRTNVSMELSRVTKTAMLFGYHSAFQYASPGRLSGALRESHICSRSWAQTPRVNGLGNAAADANSCE